MKRITSTSKFIEAIFQLQQSNMAELSNSKCWVFRGQCSSSWSVRPNIFRNDTLGVEYEVIQQALRRRPYDFRECSSDFEILTKLQHYGLCTRLLDVTLNPLVALYFASQERQDLQYGRDGRGKPIFRDGKIVYKYAYGHKTSELNIRIACALPFLDFEDGYTLKDLCASLKISKVIDSDEEHWLRDNGYQHLIEAIQTNNFVLSTYSNERLLRQSGAFIIPTNIKIVQNEGDVGSNLIKKTYSDLDKEFENEAFIIPHDKKESIRRELDFLNINEATLFPELEHQLTYIKDINSTPVGSVEQYEKFEIAPGMGVVIDSSPVLTAAPNPDVSKIVAKYIDKADAIIYSEICKSINQNIATVDWWKKETVQSKIKVEILRILRKKFSVVASKRISNSILDLLISAGSDYLQ